jgi:hypothetical protein
MEITAIEKKTFEQMQQAFEYFENQVKCLCGNNRDNNKWLDNAKACELLHISPRTLQSFRDNGILPFSQIGRKCYYRGSDIEQFINKQQIKNERK